MKKFLLFVILVSVMIALLATGKVYHVIKDKCISCKICVNKCPVKAIEMVDGKAVIDTEKCIDCGICNKVCPTKAIEYGEKPVEKEEATSTTLSKPKENVKDSVKTILEEPGKVEKKEKQTIFSILKDKCIGCNLCTKSCPVDAISMKNGKAVIDQDKCIDCGICINGNQQDYKGCPVKAIEKKEE